MLVRNAPINEPLNQKIEHLIRGRFEKTAASYGSDIKHFENFCKLKDLNINREVAQ